MKKKAICLLMSAMLAAAVLSGCGDKDADSRAEEAVNNQRIVRMRDKPAPFLKYNKLPDKRLR